MEAHDRPIDPPPPDPPPPDPPPPEPTAPESVAPTDASHASRTLLFFATLVLLFGVGRVLFTLSHLPQLAAQPWTARDLSVGFARGLRFDAFVAAHLAVPYLLLFWSRRANVHFVRNSAVATTVVVLWSLTVADRYYYDYYHDHFNVFFWEFWDNASNAHLALASMCDELPMVALLTTILVGAAALIGLDFAARRVPVFERLPWLRGRPTTTSALVLALLVLAVGPFDARTLAQRHRHDAVSTHGFINVLARNPVLALNDSIVKKREARDFRVLLPPDPMAQQALAAAVARDIGALPGSHSPGARGHPVRRTIESHIGDVLVRKPRHVVVVMLESYSGWVLDHPDAAFRHAMAGTLLRLMAGGTSVRQHFPSGHGTIKNIAAVNFGFPLPRDFHPALPYHQEARKAFASMPVTWMKREGYRTQFFYAGLERWHDLHAIIPQAGYDQLYAEHSFPNAPHHEFGLHDGDLYTGIASVLAAATGPTFSFVMTQSNHAPFRVPAGFQRDGPLPASVRGLMAFGADNVEGRFTCFQYADRALGAFLDFARKQSWFADTLFVFTGDHPFYGIGESPEAHVAMSTVPLVFYAPDLMRPAWRGKRLEVMSQHLDIGPSLLGLVRATPATVDAWGCDLFASPHPRQSWLFNDAVDCRLPFCWTGRELVEQRGDGQWSVVADPAVRERERRAIDDGQARYRLSGLQYLYGY